MDCYLQIHSMTTICHSRLRSWTSSCHSDHSMGSTECHRKTTVARSTWSGCNWSWWEKDRERGVGKETAGRSGQGKRRTTEGREEEKQIKVCTYPTQRSSYSATYYHFSSSHAENGQRRLHSPLVFHQCRFIWCSQGLQHPGGRCTFTGKERWWIDITGPCSSLQRTQECSWG